MRNVSLRWPVGLIVTVGIAFGAVWILQGSPVESDPLTLVVDPLDAYDPVASGETMPDGYRQLVWRDQIEPVYEPSFTTSDALAWPDDMLVIGVAGENEAKAYPVTHLNSREMVIDEIEGIPILVSW